MCFSTGEGELIEKETIEMLQHGEGELMEPETIEMQKPLFNDEEDHQYSNDLQSVQ